MEVVSTGGEDRKEWSVISRDSPRPSRQSSVCDSPARSVLLDVSFEGEGQLQISKFSHRSLVWPFMHPLTCTFLNLVQISELGGQVHATLLPSL